MDNEKYKNKLQLKLKQQQEILKTTEAEANAIRLPHCRDGGEIAEERERSVIIDNTLQLSQQNVRHIEVALAKIEKGKYGFCNRCVDVISSKRLTIAPESEFCLKCQEEIDTNNR
ncbi:MAG: hypothetical protein V7749_03315 [Cocleimonas sp.]